MNEKVPFRLIHMPCCGQLLCWINPRIPNYCPECGSRVYMRLKGTLPEPTHMWLRTVSIDPVSNLLPIIEAETEEDADPTDEWKGTTE